MRRFTKFAAVSFAGLCAIAGSLWVWFAKYSEEGLTVGLPVWAYSQERDKTEPATYSLHIHRSQINPWGTLWRTTMRNGWLSAEPQAEGVWTLQKAMEAGRNYRPEEHYPERPTSYLSALRHLNDFMQRQSEKRLVILPGGPVAYFEHYGWAISGIRTVYRDGSPALESLYGVGMIWREESDNAAPQDIGSTLAEWCSITVEISNLTAFTKR